MRVAKGAITAGGIAAAVGACASLVGVGEVGYAADAGPSADGAADGPSDTGACDGCPIVFAGPLGSPHGIAADDAYVYFAVEDDFRIDRCPRAACPPNAAFVPNRSHKPQRVAVSDGGL